MRAVHADLDADLAGFAPERPPVVLLGGLNLLRPLGMAGIPAIVASGDERPPAFHSRYCSARYRMPPLEHRDAALTALVRLGERLMSALGTRAPLMYGNDESLELVQEGRGVLERHFRMTLNDASVAHALIAKDTFGQLAREHGLPVPARLEWEGLASVAGPVLVKPRSKVGFEEQPMFHRLFGAAGKARVYATGRDLLRDPVARQLGERLVLQQYVPGDDRCLWSFHGFADDSSRVLAWFTGRKIRTSPPLTGASAYLELANDGALAELGHQMVERIGLKGPFKIDFKRDADTGRFYVLEVNARYNLWHYLGAANGVNLPKVAYEYAVAAARPGKARWRTSTRWLCLSLDYRAYRSLAAQGRLSALRWLASLVFSPKVYDLFSWRDPAPFLAWLRERVAALPRKLPGRLMTQFRRWLSTAS